MIDFEICIYKKKKMNFLFLKKSKIDLDRQRAKGPNHNPTKVSFIENQIRQYEQQLSDIKRRLDFIEVKLKFFFKL
jgi:predicted  nucleic acid-binding Zn-ribbon protein